MARKGVCDIALNFFKIFLKPQNSKILIMSFPR